MQFTPRQRRFNQVGRIHRTFGFPSTNQRVHFVNEQNDFAVCRRNLVQDRFQTLLKLAAIFRTGNQRAHIQRHQLFVGQTFRHITVDDTQCQPLGNGGFTHAGFADQNRVVLGAPR